MHVCGCYVYGCTDYVCMCVCLFFCACVLCVCVNMHVKGTCIHVYERGYMRACVWFEVYAYICACRITIMCISMTSNSLLKTYIRIAIYGFWTN